jgi:hypothetical protein
MEKFGSHQNHILEENSIYLIFDLISLKENALFKQIGQDTIKATLLR